MTRQVNFHFLENAETCQGYEIHMGETRPVPGVSVVPLNKLEDGGEDVYKRQHYRFVGIGTHKLSTDTDLCQYVNSPVSYTHLFPHYLHRHLRP